jgi:hypothetical protein
MLMRKVLLSASSMTFNCIQDHTNSMRYGTLNICYRQFNSKDTTDLFVVVFIIFSSSQTYIVSVDDL